MVNGKPVGAGGVLSRRGGGKVGALSAALTALKSETKSSSMMMKSFAGSYSKLKERAVLPVVASSSSSTGGLLTSSSSAHTKSASLQGRSKIIFEFVAAASMFLVLGYCWVFGKREKNTRWADAVPTVPLICAAAACAFYCLTKLMNSGCIGPSGGIPRRVVVASRYLSLAVLTVFLTLWYFAERFIEGRTTSVDTPFYVAGTPSKYSLVNVALAAINGMVSAFVPPEEGAPFVDWKSIIPEAKAFELSKENIRTEVERLLANKEIAIPRYGEVDPLQSGEKWGVFAFKYHGDLHESNCAQCPSICDVLKKLPQIELAMLSILDPGADLRPHYGVFRQIMRLHYPIIIPTGASITVDGNAATWTEGEMILFDDTYLHSVRNDADTQRVVIFMNIARPSTPRIFSWLLEVFAGSYLRDVNKRIEAASRKKNAARDRM